LVNRGELTEDHCKVLCVHPVLLGPVGDTVEVLEERLQSRLLDWLQTTQPPAETEEAIGGPRA
jgi:hypothetical protein